jgi:hypothetical protein
MSSVGLALSRTTSVSQEFAQEPAPNRIPISPTPDAAISGPGSNSVLSNLPEDTVTISNALLPAPRNQPTKGGVCTVKIPWCPRLRLLPLAAMTF